MNQIITLTIKNSANTPASVTNSWIFILIYILLWLLIGLITMAVIAKGMIKRRVKIGLPLNKFLRFFNKIYKIH